MLEIKEIYSTGFRTIVPDSPKKKSVGMLDSRHISSKSVIELIKVFWLTLDMLDMIFED